ncbi:MAG: 50S ribosomal protein L11 methyltransferase, partial [Candidatus Brocadiae bacterium]|nr:50S ribosomal protein L11 methyltransferase [Candidatus Brocadiia bacterium]
MLWFRLTALVPSSSSEDASASLAELGCSGVRIEDGDPARLEAHFENDVSAAAAAVLAPWGGWVETSAWVEEEDWTTAWRRRVPTLVVGPFCIHPTHEPPRPGAINLRLDPGMAFGTGEHPTTRLMLLEIAAMAATAPLGRFLDLGCGTGILAMAAAALGAGAVVAADT